MEHPPRRPANPESFCLSSRPRDLMSSPLFCKALLGCAPLCPALLWRPNVFPSLRPALLGCAWLCPALLCSGDLTSSPLFGKALLGCARLCLAVLGFARLYPALGT